MSPSKSQIMTPLPGTAVVTLSAHARPLLLTKYFAVRSDPRAKPRLLSADSPASSIVTGHATARLILKHGSSFIFIGVHEARMPGALSRKKITPVGKSGKSFSRRFRVCRHASPDPQISHNYVCNHAFMYIYLPSFFYEPLDMKRTTARAVLFRGKNLLKRMAYGV